MVEPGEFEVVPFVQLQKRHLLRPDGEAEPQPAVERVRALAAKGLVAVIDADGLRRNKADLDTLRKMGEKGNLWADAGSRFGTDAMDLFVAGAERVTLRWHHLADEAELREAHEMSDALFLGLEFRGGAFQPHPALGGEDRATALARELNLPVVVLDPGAKPGNLDRSLAARLQSSGLDRWFLGGIRDGGDVAALKELGYRGCLVEADLAGQVLP